MSPVSRRELLDVGHEVQKLQTLLQDLQDWARKLQAEMATQGTPCSPVRIQYMLEEHQAYKVSPSPEVRGLSNVTPHYPTPSSDPC